MTPIQSEILRILQSNTDPLKREDIIALLPQGQKCSKRRVQDHIAALESDGYAVISGDEGYELVAPERNNLDRYEHSILTLYAHSESEREAADRKWVMLRKFRSEQRKCSRFAVQSDMFAGATA